MGTGADAGKVAGLVLKTRKGLELVAATSVQQTPSGVLELRPEAELRPLRQDDNFIMLRQDLLDRQIIDVHGRKVVRVNDVDLQWFSDNGEPEDLRVREVEVGLRGAVRRLFKGALPAQTLGVSGEAISGPGDSLGIRRRDRGGSGAASEAQDRT